MALVPCLQRTLEWFRLETLLANTGGNLPLDSPRPHPAGGSGCAWALGNKLQQGGNAGDQSMSPEALALI